MAPSDIPPGTVVDTIRHVMRRQRGIEHIGCGSSGWIWDVNNAIVLKTPSIYERPAADANAKAHRDYARGTCDSYEDIQTEKTNLKRVGTHRNIVRVITLDHPEGIYLQRYKPLPERLAEGSSVAQRLTWYIDICRALEHLHSRNLTLANLRLRNMLVDEKDRAIVCDLGNIADVGEENPWAKLAEKGDEESIDIFDTSPVFCSATDIFALATLIYEVEKNENHLERMKSDKMESPAVRTRNGELETPPLHFANSGLDRIVEKAWRGSYEEASEIRAELEALAPSSEHDEPLKETVADNADAITEVESWRRRRIEGYGAVLDGLLNDDEIQSLRDTIQGKAKVSCTPRGSQLVEM